MDLLELFPTVIGVFQYDDFHREAPAWRQAVGCALRERQEQSMVKRHPQRQTGDRLHEKLELKTLVGFFMESSEQYMAAMKYSPKIKLKMQCCWATVGFLDDRLEMHMHPNSFISGAFYLDVEDLAEPILFRDPRSQNRHYDLPVDEENRMNLKHWTVPAQNGRLVLFPSWLEHKVGPNRSVAPRLSLSFNLTVHGEVGHLNRMTRAWL